VLLWVSLLLVATHVALQTWHYQLAELPWLLLQLFDLDLEQNLPTGYSTAVLALASLLLLLLAGRKRLEGDRWTRHWLALALGFGLLSLDEVAGLHETLNTALPFSWAIPGGIAAALVALLYLGFLRALPPRTRWGFVAAGALFLGGAVGVEFGTEWYAQADLMDTLAYNLWTAVEEGLEMTGVVLFIHTLMGYMAPHSSLQVAVEVTA
jgi:hypothetical protein